MKIPSQIAVMIFLATSSYGLAMPHPEESGISQLQNLVRDHIRGHSLKLAEKGYRSEYEIGKLDPRLNIKPCTESWSIDFSRPPLKSQNTSLLLECYSGDHQKFFLNVEFKIFAPVVTSSRLIARGQVINEADLQISEQQINAARQPGFSATKQVLGMVAKRTIRPGRQISPSLLTAPRLVSRGDEVIIIATNDNISIKMKGEALNGGALGQQITVKNLQSQRRIRARIAERGVVEVAL